MRFALIGWAFIVILAPVASGDDGLRPEAALWQKIEPKIFDSERGKQFIGESVICTTGKVISRSPLVVQLKRGITVYVTHVNRADRVELSEYEQLPYAKVEGWISQVDAGKHTVTIKAHSVDFRSDAPRLFPCAACPSGFREL